jgi:hypothetical protein
MPTVQENSFCGLFTSSFVFHVESSIRWGYLSNAFIAAVAFSLAGILSHYALRTVDKPLDYSQMAQIYDSVLPMDVYYNSLVGPPFGQESTDQFMESLSAAAGSGTLTLKPQVFATKETDQAWKEYYISMIDQFIPEGTIGSYSIQ